MGDTTRRKAVESTTNDDVIEADVLDAESSEEPEDDSDDSYGRLVERAVKAGFGAERRELSLISGEIREIVRITLFPVSDDESDILRVSSPKVAAEVLATEFDAFRPLREFDAVWSGSKHVVECGLESDRRMPTRHLLSTLARMFGQRQTGEEMEGGLVVQLPSPVPQTKVTLRTSSKEFAFLRGGGRPSRVSLERRAPVIVIEGLQAKSADEAATALDRIANALLFQIDLATGIVLYPARPRRMRHFGSGRERRRPELRTPGFQYDREPMALYWYGRSAGDMPLLRFLAFYQVAEFYFPRYSTEKVLGEVQRRLKDPRFDAANPEDIRRLIECVRPSRGGRGFGDERTQLQATIQGSMSPEVAREFFGEERVQRFYETTGKKMPIVPVGIPLGDEADPRPQMAERLYAIRCRIVHTKSEADDATILLPFSREALLLEYDIELMEFVARQTLIATSRPFNL